MRESVSPERFHEIEWRVVRDDVCAHFRTASMAQGVTLVDVIGRLADAEDRLLTVDLRPDGVTVRLPTTSRQHFIWLSEGDLDLARRISDAARERGAQADPSALQKVQVMIDALVIPDVMPFWRAVLGYEGVEGVGLLDRLFQARQSRSSRWTRRARSGTGSTSTCLRATRPGGGTCRGGARRRWPRRQ